jgi:pyruvate dehydrogenase E2 component (dihydrolipoamide acetyltransferase)
MAFEIKLPSLSAGMEDAVISRWLVEVGAQVRKGQALAEVETDKATMEMEAEADGTVGSLNVDAGQRADVGQVIAVLLAAGEALPEISGVALQQTQIDPVVPTAVARPVVAETRKHAASPLARRLAASSGVTLEGIKGSGPHGRIVKIDVEREIAAASVSPPAVIAAVVPYEGPAGIGPYSAQPLSNMRRTIARRLVESKTTIPHFYLSADCTLDALLALRTQINAGREASQRISVNDFVIKAAALALRQHPQANVIWAGDRILHLDDVDISVAVTTEGGLITPILRAADRKSLGTLSAEMKGLAARAREGQLKPEEYQGGGFTVSNLGMFGVKTFSAIINPPQSCILAVGASEQRPIARDGAIALAEVMTVTLSVDHRSIDGVMGAKLLAAFKEAIEAPLSLLV